MAGVPAYLMVSDEIVSTEATFVSQMEVLSLVYIQPLRAAQPQIIDAATQMSLFSNVETLLAFNTKLLDDLEKDKAANAQGGRQIGLIFSQVSLVSCSRDLSTCNFF